MLEVQSRVIISEECVNGGAKLIGWFQCENEKKFAVLGFMERGRQGEVGMLL